MANNLGSQTVYDTTLQLPKCSRHRQLLWSCCWSNKEDVPVIRRIFLSASKDEPARPSRSATSNHKAQTFSPPLFYFLSLSSSYSSSVFVYCCHMNTTSTAINIQIITANTVTTVTVKLSGNNCFISWSERVLKKQKKKNKTTLLFINAHNAHVYAHA